MFYKVAWREWYKNNDRNRIGFVNDTGKNNLLQDFNRQLFKIFIKWLLLNTQLNRIQQPFLENECTFKFRRSSLPSVVT